MQTFEKLDLRPGEWVEVRSEQEILSTLDDGAALDGLVFMPEMLAFCGQRFRVYKRADKTCDTIRLTGMLRMHDTVHLQMTRCDGAAHGGCQAACLLFWKEAWLRRVDEAADDLRVTPGAAERPPRDRDWLASTARQAASTADDPCFRCQATELPRATSPLRWWEPTQYVRDVRTNEVPLRTVVRSLIIHFWNRIAGKLRLRPYPYVAGPLKRTPVEVLDLQPGEWVVVKSRDEIVATVDKAGKNRGMTFEAEMIPYCGKCYRVVQRVDRILDEATGRMKELGSVGIILEDVICASAYRTPCPRANYLYWREIWLRRAEPDEIPKQSERDGLCVLNAQGA